MIVGLGNGKSFVKRYREYVKSGRKHTRLLDMTKSLLVFQAFLRDSLGLDLHVGFELLACKVEYFRAASADDQGLPSSFLGLEALMQKGFAEHVKASPEDGSQSDLAAASGDVSATIWLRVLLFHTFADALKYLSSSEDRAKKGTEHLTMFARPRNSSKTSALRRASKRS